ncbi:predicted protein, partial [Nematostella vectensis]
EYIDVLEDRYICNACRMPLNHPMQAQCGHRFCKHCIDVILISPFPACPRDGQTIQALSVFHDRCALVEMQALPCYCHGRCDGCQWTGPVAMITVHEEVCAFIKVSCIHASDGCGEIMLRFQLAKHVEKECPFRLITCVYCQNDVPERTLIEHLKKCPAFPIECPNECGVKRIERKKLSAHTRECPNALTDCRFSPLGCTYKVKKIALREHQNKHVIKHMILLGRTTGEPQPNLLELENQLERFDGENTSFKTELERHKYEFAQMKERFNDQNARLGIVEKTVANQKGDIAEIWMRFDQENLVGEVRMRDKLKKFKVKTKANKECLLSLMKRLEVQDDSQTNPNKLNRRLSQLESSITIHKTKLFQEDLRIQIQQAISYDGTFLWKIDKFTERYAEAKSGNATSIYSSPFYTHRFGYKLCARLFPNGDGSARDNYLSIFIALMRGEYDSILPWPFQETITITLIDQDNGMNISETFDPDPCSISFQRPTRNINVASGCPRFCSQTVLRTRGYMNENCVFVKVVVD